jgi:hypothetical protein
MRFFLLVFDRANSRLVDDVAEFESSDEALTMRLAREAQERVRGHGDIEVVVLGAENREALEATHSRYFGSPMELAG